MQVIELNAVGNFDTWDPSKIGELQNAYSSNALKKLVLFENDAIRLWNIRLRPHERIPFYKRKQHYSWTCLTDGMVILRNGNGQINMIKFNKGETNYWNLGKQGTIADIENIGANMVVLNVIEYIHDIDRII